jgi:hypothetical protein
MYSRTLVPADFVVPTRIEGDGLHLRMLSVHDVIKDFDAVMASADHLIGTMDPASTWPLGLTIEDNLIDLAWHHREFTIRHSFAYTVIAPDESLCLGCTYLYPSDKASFDAMAFYWARGGDPGLDARIGLAFRGSIAKDWPLQRVAFPGRDVDWPAWLALPDARNAA